MSKRIARHCAALIALTFSTIAVGEGTDPSGTAPATTSDTTGSPGQTRVAGKFGAPFATLAGSRENAVALATALRTGSPATLTYTSTGPRGTTITKTITITPPTKPMGWGNVSHSLALAQFALAQQGISNPTGPQLQAALNGGTLTTADGKSVTMAGVLQQRADGMGWGKIAQSYGTTMGAANHGLKAPATTTTPTPVATTTPTKPTTPPAITNGAGAANAPSAKVVTTAGGNAAAGAPSGKGMTTAAGNASATAQGGKGITTANGASGGSNSGGVVSADGGAQGNGNAYGRGVVTASGSTAAVASSTGAGSASNGIVTGAGAAGGVVTADPARGGGAANGHAKGKGGG
jgi:hypothetical protein